MKTTKIYTAISLLLIFAALTPTFAANVGKGAPSSLNTMVRYQVNVNLSNEKTICNLYQVEILDGKGQMVAPPKTFTAGVSTYEFFERGPAAGVRIAALVMVDMHSHYICATELFTTPAALNGPFLGGVTYRFDLYPQSGPIK